MSLANNTQSATRLAPDMVRLRDEIEAIDRELVDLINRRVRLARQIGACKREGDLATLDPAREAAVVRRAAALARDAGLDEDIVRDVYWHLIGLCRGAQMERQ